MIDKETRIEQILDRINDLLSDAYDAEYEFDLTQDLAQELADEITRNASGLITDSHPGDFSVSYDNPDDLFMEMEMRRGEFEEIMDEVFKQVAKLKRLAPRDWKARLRDADLGCDSGSVGLKVLFKEFGIRA